MEDNYTIIELFEMLKKDESWESDPEKREEIVNSFFATLLMI